MMSVSIPGEIGRLAKDQSASILMRQLSTVFRDSVNHRIVSARRRAAVLYDQGEYELALTLYEELRRSFECLSGPDPLFRLSALHSEIYCLERLKRWNRAISLCKELTTIRQHKLGKKHESSVDAFQWWAWLTAGSRDFPAASSLYYELADIYSSKSEPEVCARMRITAEYFENDQYVDVGHSRILYPIAHSRRTFNGVAHLLPKSVDIFLSHASEDKDSIARPLKDALERLGMSVFFDEISIQWGESIAERLQSGIQSARFAIVILSPNFSRKVWTKIELQSLQALFAASGRNNILPLWHDLSRDDALSMFTLLTPFKALRTDENTIDEIASFAKAVLDDPNR